MRGLRNIILSVVFHLPTLFRYNIACCSIGVGLGGSGHYYDKNDAVLTLSPSSSRIASGTLVHMSCDGRRTPSRWDELWFSAPNPFIANPAMRTLSCSWFGWDTTHHSHTKHITVVPKAPTIEIRTLPGTAFTTGDFVNLFCNGEDWGASPTRTFKFMKDGKTVQSSSDSFFKFIIGSKTTGEYSCIVLAGGVASSSSSKLSITSSLPKPQIESTHRRPMAGETVKLSCDSKLRYASSSVVEYTFLKDSTAIYKGASPTFSFITTDSSSGNYMCVVNDEQIISEQSQPVSMKVFVVPTIPPTTRHPIVFSCETGPNAVDFYVYPFDPAQFIHCEGGQAYIENCPRGEVWSQANLVCKNPDDVIG